MNAVYRTTQIGFACLFRILGRIWFRLDINGGENIAGLKGPLIIVSNHKSYIDPFLLLAAALKRRQSGLLPVRAMAKDSLYKKPVVGWILRLLGCYPARRGEGLDVSLAAPLKILSDKGVVGVYPEGKRVHGEELGEFKRGAAELVLRSRARVLPVAVFCGDFVSRTMPKFGSRVFLYFGEAFSPEIGRSAEETTNEIRGRVNELYGRIKNGAACADRPQ